MTPEQECHFNMYLALHNFFVKNKDLTLGLPGFDSIFNPFSDAISEIRKIREQQESDITGTILTKYELRDLVVEQAADLERRLVAYDSMKANAGLLKEVHYTEFDLAASPDNVLSDRIRVILDHCVTNFDELKSFGLEQQNLDELEQNLTAYIENRPRPRLGKTEQKQSTARLAELFKTGDTFLGKIDTLVAIFQVSHSNFFNFYRYNRHLFDITNR